MGQTLSDVDGISAIESLHTNGKNTETPIVYSWEGIEKTLLERATAVGAKYFFKSRWKKFISGKYSKTFSTNISYPTTMSGSVPTKP